MRPDDRDKAYLWDMLDAALAIEQFVRGETFESYLANRMMRGAVERHIEIIGEYDEVLHETVWAIATRRVPELIVALRAILPDDLEGL